MPLITSQITFLQIVEMIKQFATDHREVNTTDYGPVSQLIESATEGNWNYKDYTILYVVDDDPVVEFSEGQVVHNIQVVLCGIEFDKDAPSRELEIKSDMMWIYQDLLAYLKVQPEVLNNEVRIFINGTSTGVSFKERFDSNLTGLLFSLSLKQPINLNFCSIPMD